MASLASFDSLGRIVSEYTAPRHGALFWSFKLVTQKLVTWVKLNCRSLIFYLPRKAGQMSYQAIKEYLLAILSRYKQADKKGKTALLNEATQVTHLSRKHLIRCLKLPQETLQKKKLSGRKAKYPPDLLLPHIRYLWGQMERISGRRMKAAYADWLPFHQTSEFTVEIRLLLERMSVATLERLLRKLRGEIKAGKGLSLTPQESPSRYMKNKVPLNTFDAKIERPGFFQADTVGHCGTSVEGQFIFSITLTDIDSTWTENRATFSKKAHGVRRQFADLDQSIPFDIVAVNVDNGSEFLNTQMINFMRRENGKNPIQFTRSRPYKKNDNCYVEQKNFTHVRELFGYERMEDPSLVVLMNDIYKTCWNPLQNFFIPSFKLKEKVRVGARIVKKFGPPQTPYDRLMKSPHVSEERKQELRKMKAKLNPFDLKRDLEAKLAVFFEQLRKSKIREVS